MTHARNCPAVLVVDDEALLRLDATEALRYAGCTTYEACHALEALEMLGLHPDICVLFTDINMPGDLDGLALARHVHGLHPHIRMIITSGHEKPSASELPQDGSFVAKPYNMDDITEIICRASRRDPQLAEVGRGNGASASLADPISVLPREGSAQQIPEIALAEAAQSNDTVEDRHTS